MKETYKEYKKRRGTIFDKLKKLYELNKENTNKSNDNLMKFLYDEGMLWNAVEKLKKNKGAATFGPTNNKDRKSIEIDGLNLGQIKRLSEELREETFKWSPTRRIEVPKKNNKRRPLGIFSFEDRIVQEGIRTILNAIYEPTFSGNNNHGFRPRLSSETALELLKRNRKGKTHAIEGDIKKAYEGINHNILMKILKKKINDKKFLRIIEEGLKCGIEKNRKIYNSITVVPQGSICSPILFNIYMNEFDEAIKTIIEEIFTRLNESRDSRKSSSTMNKEYKILKSRSDEMNKKIRERLKQESPFIKTLLKSHKKIRWKLKRKKAIDYGKRTLEYFYLRYADDWIIITNGNVRVCEEIKIRISTWIKEELKLELEQSKTRITNMEKDPIKFLGFSIMTPINTRIGTIEKKIGIRTTRRTNLGPRIGPDYERIIERLIERKFVNEKRQPIQVSRMVDYKPFEIVTQFNLIIRGLFGYYYQSIDQKSRLNRLYYLIKYSCYKTLAARYKSSIRKVISRHGPNMEIREKKIQVNFPSYGKLMSEFGKRTIKRWKEIDRLLTKSVLKIDEKTHLELDPFSPKINLRTGYKLEKQCLVCGAEATSNNRLETHHVNEIKNKTVRGFSEIM
uniref:Orf621 n=1 Tax=Rhodomonas salina TaxID=3034 RepID=Q9G8T4_RHDSA|nr:orf621 [Rhodomonas salina]AAG17763.1 orf621 [Rhodomonas salina]